MTNNFTVTEFEIIMFVKTLNKQDSGSKRSHSSQKQTNFYGTQKISLKLEIWIISKKKKCKKKSTKQPK